MIATKETYEAATAMFAEAKQAAAEIRISGWTVYEIVPQENSSIPAFHLSYKVIESLEAAMSHLRDRRSQYFIAEEKFAADGTRFSVDGMAVEKFTGYGVTGWIHDRECVPWGEAYPAGHDRWFHVRLGPYAHEATVLDGVLRPAEWCRTQGLLRGDIRLIFEAGEEDEGGCCDGDCCCGDSDSGSEGGENDADSDDE